MASMTGIAMYVNSDVARAAREMGVLLLDYNYNPAAIEAIVRYTIHAGTPTGAPGLDREDEADAAAVFEAELEAVPFDSPAWGEFADEDLPPVCGGGPEPGEEESIWWSQQIEADRYEPSPADWAAMNEHRDDDFGDLASPCGSWD